MASITSTGSGNWSSTTPDAPWPSGTVPVEGDTATIATGHTVTQDQNIVIGADSGNALTINGTFDVPYNIASDYSLTLKGNITIGSSGEFKIGSSSNRLDLARLYTIYINYSASLAARKYSFTVPSTGKISWYGVEKAMHTTHTGVTAGTDPTMTVASATGWQVGDIIVLVDETDRTKCEKLTIKAGYTPESTSVSLSGTLSNNKTSGWLVFNLSSNIRVKNYDNSYKSYVELVGTGTYQNVLSNVMFDTLGDSSKNGLIVGQKTSDNSNSNFNINMYSCYQLTITSNNNFNNINIYNSGSNGLVLGNATVNYTFNELNIIKSNLAAVLCSSYARNVNIETLRIVNNQNTSNINAKINTFYIENLITKGNTGNVFTGLVVDGRIGSIEASYAGTVFGSDVGFVKVQDMVCDNNTYDINLNTCGRLQIENYTPSTNGINVATYGPVSITNYNGTLNDNRVYIDNCYMMKETTVYRTSSPSMNVYINTSNTKVVFNLSGLARTMYVTSGNTVTVDLYSRKDASSTGAVAKLRIAKGTSGYGLSETQEYDILPSSVDTWESKSWVITGTTSNDGFIDIELVVSKGSTAWNLYIDDLTITES